MYILSPTFKLSEKAIEVIQNSRNNCWLEPLNNEFIKSGNWPIDESIHPKIYIENISVNAAIWILMVNYLEGYIEYLILHGIKSFEIDYTLDSKLKIRLCEDIIKSSSFNNLKTHWKFIFEEDLSKAFSENKVLDIIDGIYYIRNLLAHSSIEKNVYDPNEPNIMKDNSFYNEDLNKFIIKLEQFKFISKSFKGSIKNILSISPCIDIIWDNIRDFCETLNDYLLENGKINTQFSTPAYFKGKEFLGFDDFSTSNFKWELSKDKAKL